MLLHKRLLFATAIVFILLCEGCGTGLKWQRHIVDGHLTGVTAPVGDNVESSLGKIVGDKYVAPNGKSFSSQTSNSTFLTAKYMIDAQAGMADLKSVWGYAPHDMIAELPESELTNFIVDNMMLAVEKITGRKVDIGITNIGGIRVDIHNGNVLKDDIVSMLPFNNHLIFLTLKGKDVLDIFRTMAENGVQVVGGVHIEIQKRTVKELLINGEPLDLTKMYSVATIDFLLKNGDGFSIGKEAKEFIETNVTLCDVILNAVKELTANGCLFEYHKDGRVVLFDE